jgi:hypothetical protein
VLTKQPDATAACLLQHCEYNPVFYDTTQLECTASGTLWLSDTPWLPNTKFAGAAFPRIATYARWGMALHIRHMV